MKRFTKGTLPDTDVEPEWKELDVWEKPVLKESPQTIRNVGRIEQLEAGQTENREKIEQILSFLAEIGAQKTKKQVSSTFISWLLSKNITYRISWRTSDIDFEEDLSLWERAQIDRQHKVRVIEQILPQYYDRLDKVKEIFTELEQDFNDIARRVARCEVLEEDLAVLENSLEVEETEYLGWCISLIRDVLDYNYAEDLNKQHLDLLKKGIDLIYNKELECDKEDYQNLHKEFLQSGLALIPTTQKAIDKYGD